MHRRITLCLAALLTLSTSLARAEDKPDTVVPVPRDGKWTMVHESINAQAMQGDIGIVFLGDSITAGWARNGKEVWDKFYGPRKPLNAGIGGDRTQHVLWRLDNGNINGIQPKLAVLMIGTNNSGANTSEDIAKGVKAIVERLRAKLPETKVLVLGIFPRGPDAEDAKRKVNIGANEIVKTLADGKMIHYLDISDKFLAADGTLSKDIMPDLLHLSPQGYQIWAESIEPQVAALIKK